jgi:general nucleoside transport system permease protein
VTALVAFLLSGIVIVVTTGKAPWGVYRAVVQGSGLDWPFQFGSHSVGLPLLSTRVWFPWDTGSIAAENLQQTLLVTTPLILTGLAVAFAYRSGLFNIGGQGQYIVGSIVAVWSGSSWAGMPHLPHVVLCMVLATVVGTSWVGLFGPAHAVLAIAAAAVAGAAWAALAGLLRAAFGAHEVITTIMLNWIAVWVGNYLFGSGGPLQAKGQVNPISGDVAQSAHLHVWWGDPTLQGLHVGLFVALGALVVYALLLERTTLGFEIRAVGANPESARYSGISVPRSMVAAMAVSGVFAGTAGAIDILGWQFHLTTQDVNASTIGFIGIAVALLGRNNAVGILFSALLFGALSVGTSTRQLDPDVFDPGLASNLTLIIQGLVLLFVGADVLVLGVWRRLRRRR